MRNGTIIQIKGLGIPVQSASDRNTEGYEIRWSSDPEISESARAHVLIGSDELRRFIELAVDKRFLSVDYMQITPVQIQDDQRSLSREQSIQAGVNPNNWDTVRVGIVVAGNGPRGPVMDTIEWIGSREEYNEGSHLHEGYEHAKTRDLSPRSVQIYTHPDSGQIAQAADFFQQFRRQLRPSLRASETLAAVLEAKVCEMDVSNIHPDKAAFYLQEIQKAFIQRRNYREHELSEVGMTSGAGTSEGAQRPQADVEEEPGTAPEPSPRSTGPRFH